MGGQCTNKLLNTIVTTQARQDLSKELTRNAVTMLKNEQATLPLRSGQTIAVLGEICARDVGMFMDTSPFHGRDSYFMGGSGRVVPKTTVNVLEGLIEKCQAKGCIVKAYTSNDVGGALDFVCRGPPWRPQPICQVPHL